MLIDDQYCNAHDTLIGIQGWADKKHATEIESMVRKALLDFIERIHTLRGLSSLGPAPTQN